jgi:hypothetical protein
VPQDLLAGLDAGEHVPGGGDLQRAAAPAGRAARMVSVITGRYLVSVWCRFGLAARSAEPRH